MLGFFISKSSLWFLSLLSSLGEDDTCPEENEDLALKEASLENKGRTSNPSESATFCQWKAIFGIGIVGYVKLTALTLDNAAVMAA
ncbi:hypothetical protein F2Q70_00007686 [Brassica cretica]|uniref:Uncharacterized protein n=1 Tax=Brassica cretica TaxID=69181 RepID=A0A8S9M9L9_BRACR|nr:hypothetical protein F2Q70_00007686 [Brassica cretica]